uniref:Putative tick til 1 n=1 Tax=Amblyomma aureolatum TaxID=187763 RepID=A0A1E1WZ39_9ACAR
MPNLATMGVLLLVAVCAYILQASAELPTSQAAARRPGINAGGFRPLPPWFRGCRRHEEYKQCVSSTCSELKCWKRKLGPFCTKDCRSGCFCKKGFFRNKWGKCVRSHKCNEYSRPRPPFGDHPGVPLPQPPFDFYPEVLLPRPPTDLYPGGEWPQFPWYAQPRHG